MLLLKLAHCARRHGFMRLSRWLCGVERELAGLGASHVERRRVERLTQPRCRPQLDWHA